MNSSRLQLGRLDPDGEPGALVATWLMGELIDVPGISVVLTDQEIVTLGVSPVGAMAGVRSRVGVLLTEPRFAGWRLQSV